jgi:hypothetical protein
MYINNCVHIMFKIWGMTIILYYLLLCTVHMMRRKCEKMLWGPIGYNYYQDRSFLTGCEECPALVISKNVRKRTSAKDFPMFSMYTTSLVPPEKKVLVWSSIHRYIYEHIC